MKNRFRKAIYKAAYYKRLWNWAREGLYGTKPEKRKLNYIKVSIKGIFEELFNVKHDYIADLKKKGDIR